jgi:preprotein translocase SecE subunit
MADDKSIQVADAAAVREFTSREAPGGFGIYKYGYGYWVRVCTAIAVGVLFLAGAAWAWNQVQAINLPSKGHVLAIENANDSASLASGQAVELVGVNADNQQQVIGSATIAASLDRGVEISKASMLNDHVLADARFVRPSTAPGAAAAAAVPVARITNIPVVQPVYVQAGAAGLIMLVGLWTIFRYVGTKPSSVEFLIATDEEMRKVNWSTRKIIIDSTKVVVIATFLIAGLIFIFDAIMQWGIAKPIIGVGR